MSRNRNKLRQPYAFGRISTTSKLANIGKDLPVIQQEEKLCAMQGSWRLLAEEGKGVTADSNDRKKILFLISFLFDRYVNLSKLLESDAYRM
jgi:hypothetical protein